MLILFFNFFFTVCYCDNVAFIKEWQAPQLPSKLRRSRVLCKDETADVVIDIYHSHIISDIQGNDLTGTIINRMRGLTEIGAGKQTPGSITMGGILAATEINENDTLVDEGQVFLDKALLPHQIGAVKYIQKRERTPLWKESHVHIPLSSDAPPGCKQKDLFFDRFSKEVRAGPPPTTYGVAVCSPPGSGKTRVVIEVIGQELKTHRAKSASSASGGGGGGGGAAAGDVDDMNTLYVVYVRIITCSNIL